MDLYYLSPGWNILALWRTSHGTCFTSSWSMSLAKETQVSNHTWRVCSQWNIRSGNTAAHLATEFHQNGVATRLPVVDVSLSGQVADRPGRSSTACRAAPHIHQQWLYEMIINQIAAKRQLSTLNRWSVRLHANQAAAPKGKLLWCSMKVQSL